MDGNRALKEVKELITHDKLTEALQLVNNLEETHEVSTDHDFLFQLFDLKCQILRLHEDHSLLLKLADDVVNAGKTLGAHLQTVDALIKIAEALREKGCCPESLDVAKQAESVLSEEPKATSQFKQRKAALLNIIGNNLRNIGKGEEEKALVNHRRSLALYKELGQKEGIAYSLIGISWYFYYYKHNFDSSLEYAQQSLTIAEEAGHKKYISYSLTMIANYYHLKRDFNKAMELYQKSLAIRKEIGDKRLLIMAYNNIGNIYRDQGNFNKADRLYQKFLETSIQIGHKQFICDAYSNLGFLYFLRGDLNRALDYYQKALAISKELGGKRRIGAGLSQIVNIYLERGEITRALEICHQSLALLMEQYKHTSIYAWVVLDMGLLYWQKNELEQAYEYLQECLDLFNDLGIGIGRISALYYLVLICIDLNYIEEGYSYLTLLKPTPEQVTDKAHSQGSRVAEALLLKTSSRTRNRIKAEELLESVVNEEIIQNLLTVTAMLNLCDLLLVELRSSGELAILKEIMSLVNRLLGIAKTQHSYSLLVETYVLQSKLLLLELDVPRAQNLLMQAQILAEEKDLQSLVLKVNEEQKALQTQLSKLKEFVKRKASISEIIEFTQIDDYLERVVHERLFRRDLNVRTYSEEAHQFYSKMEKKA